MRRCDNGIPAFPKGERRLLNLPDCVFLTEQGRCRILRVPECTGETCSFCRIQQIEEKSIGASRRLYYVLKPVYHEDSTIFVPVDNPALIGKMHRLLRAQEVLQLLSGLAGDDGLWVEDEAQRRAAYEQILRSGDRVGMARLIRALSLQKARLGAQRTVILSTHIVSDIEHIAGTILLLRGGALLQNGPREAVLQAVRGKVWACAVPPAEAEALCARYPAADTCPVGEKVALRLLADACPCPSAQPAEPTLEDLYLYYFSEVSET